MPSPPSRRRGPTAAAAAGRRAAPRLSIVHEDRHLVVVDKPAGLLTIATDKEKRRTLYAQLFDLLKAREPRERVFIVHRLDRDASGLLVLAKTPDAKYKLQEQFRQRTAGRLYLAVVEGRFGPETQTFSSYLAESKAMHVYSTGRPDRGRLAVTQVRVVRRAANRTLLELRLETGRKHQIRVQLAEAGHPVTGDKRYAEVAADTRLMLHAARLRFIHPDTGKALDFYSAMPGALRAAIEGGGIKSSPLHVAATCKGEDLTPRPRPPRGRGSAPCKPRRRTRKSGP